MKTPVIAILVLSTLLAGCGGFRDSRLNPLNWFRPARQAVVTDLAARPQDPRALVAEVTGLKVEPHATGAIVRATGLPPTQGYWEAELVALPLDDQGRLVFEFRIFPPLYPQPEGTPWSRQIVVATSLSTRKLEGVRVIVVQGASNALSSDR
jgi:hypothetical protein